MARSAFDYLVRDGHTVGSAPQTEPALNKKTTLISSLAIALGCISGCASAADSPANGDESQDQALKSGGRAYRCVSDDTDPDTGANLELSVRVSATRLSADGYAGDYDETYHPRGNVGFARFRGFHGMGGGEYSTTILAEDAMREGAHKGRLKVQYSGEDFATTEYDCTRR